MMMRTALLLGLLVWSASTAALDVDAEIEYEARSYYELEGGVADSSVAGKLELFHRWDRRKQRLIAELFHREDRQDPSRTHSDVREAYYHHIGREAELRLGLRRVYWGVTESRHLVDIINQSDFVEDLDNEAKLGQPMFNPAFITDWGTLDLFLLPYARARTFPGKNGYPRLPFEVAVGEAQYESARGQKRLDFAARWAMVLGGADIGLSFFSG